MLALLAFFLGLEIGRSEKSNYTIPPMKTSEFLVMIACGLLCGLSVATAFALVWHQDLITPYLFGQYQEVSYKAMDYSLRSIVSAFLNTYTIGAVSTTLAFTFLIAINKKITIIGTALAVIGSFLYLSLAPHTAIGGMMFGILIFGTLSLIVAIWQAIYAARHSE